MQHVSSSTTLISLPLAKYSRAFDVTPDVQQFTWNHLTHDLSIVVDTSGGTSIPFGTPSQQLKVLQGNQMLESMPIEDMIKQCHEAIARMRAAKSNVSINNQLLPISALVRRPLIAIRWNLTNGKVRRIQLKLGTASDFDHVHNHLLALGLNMSSSTPRPSTSSSLPTVIEENENGSRSRPPPRSTETSIRPSTTSTIETLSVSNPVITNFDSSPASVFRTNSGVHQSSVQPVVFSPVSLTQSGHSDVTPNQQFTNVLTGHISHFTHAAHDMPSSASSSALVPNSFQVAEMLVPPRRELPFHRLSTPRSSGNGSAHPPDRPYTGPAAPLRASDFSRVDSVRPMTHASNVTMPPPPLPGSSRMAPRNSAVPVPTFTAELVETARPSSSTSQSNLPISDLPPLPKPTFVGTAINPTGYPLGETTSEQSPIEFCIHGTACSKEEKLQQRNHHSATTLPSLHHSRASNQDRIFSELLKSKSDQTSANLAAYAARSEDERMHMLNEFMIQQLEDDNFITLVEDLGGCWARIGLGLK
ncbi:hypothetical protein B0J11DRAFT_611431 [Dendryphion nanum]|uniref:Uncharacterized protein n=1 Tax=Dendryphion nanum TaxID=256645 RepID=A0A9P9EDJ0_9PLEO|nr:hypothetical protein B0J11DRAFT_611431 [Dendryphion nanum]